MKVSERLKIYVTLMLIQVVIIECKLYVAKQQTSFYKKYSNGMSKNKIIGTYNQTTIIKCSNFCVRNPQCVGFNVGPTNMGRNVVISCNLTKAAGRTGGDFQAQSGFAYYEKLKCNLTLKGNMPCPRDYLCCADTKPQICPPNKRGENCSKSCVSYVVYHRDLGYSKNIGQDDFVKNVAQCWEKCWKNQMCLSFTYVPLYSQCYYKDVNDVTSPRHVTTVMPVDTNLYVYDCKPYDRDVPYD